MESNNLSDFLPPAIFCLISIVFLLLWHLRIATSWQWSAGFAQTGLGFALVALPVSPTFDIFVSGVLYTGAAYCYGSAILLHFNGPMLRLERRAFVGVYLVIHTFLVFVVQSLKWELFLTDVTFACLCLFALVTMMKRATGPADRAMLISGMLVALDALTRTIVFTFFIQTSDQLADFADSSYNIAVQFTTTTIGLLFPITGLAAMTSAAIQRHRDAAERDHLTNLLNRRGFEQAVHSQSKNAVLRGAVMVCDIDHFKLINDSYGHAAGDRVIEGLAHRLQRTLGQHAAIARFGGEEFVAFFHDISLADASACAQSVRTGLAGADWRHVGIDRQITASFGVSRIEDGELTANAAIERADRALYAAKSAGRNQVAVAETRSERLGAPGADEMRSSPAAAASPVLDSRMSAA